MRARAVLAGLAAVVAAVLPTSLVVPAVSAGGAQLIGPIELVDPSDTTKVIDHGDAHTVFTVRLPADPTCPGDSANDQWRVQTYLIPVADDPSTLRYGPIGPEPTDRGQHSLFAVDTRPFVHRMLLKNPTAGQPGRMDAFPPFDFEVAAQEHIASGDYHLGIACTYFGTTAKYWQTEVVIVDDPASAGTLTWRLASTPASVFRASSSSSSWIVIAGTAAAGLALVAWVLTTRRRQRLRFASEETT